MKKQPTDASTYLTRIVSIILELHGERVILDSDLADLYGVETKRLNGQVKRNAGRFGGKYAFRLTQQEYDVLKSQSATSKPEKGLDKRRRSHVIINSSTEYIRPLAVSPLTYPERVPIPWGFFFLKHLSVVRAIGDCL